MKPAAVAAFAFLICSTALPAWADPGDVYVPAHRTANGLWVPANVPTSSGGTHRVPTLRATKAAKPVAAHPATVPPLLVAADPVRR
jgi:hypothetical protein